MLPLFHSSKGLISKLMLSTSIRNSECIWKEILFEFQSGVYKVQPRQCRHVNEATKFLLKSNDHSYPFTIFNLTPCMQFLCSCDWPKPVFEPNWQKYFKYLQGGAVSHQFEWNVAIAHGRMIIPRSIIKFHLLKITHHGIWTLSGGN